MAACAPAAPGDAVRYRSGASRRLECPPRAGQYVTWVCSLIMIVADGTYGSRKLKVALTVML